MCNDDDNDDDTDDDYNDANDDDDNNDDDDDDVSVMMLQRQRYNDFRTIWHLTRSQYGHPMVLDRSFWCRKLAFFCTLCPNFSPKFGLETGRRLCYEDLLLLEFLTM